MRSRETRDCEVLRPMLRLALSAQSWTEDGISTRSVRGVSGHNGEHWSAIAAGLGRLLELGDTASAEEAQSAIEKEIDREQAVFADTIGEIFAHMTGKHVYRLMPVKPRWHCQILGAVRIHLQDFERLPDVSGID